MRVVLGVRGGGRGGGRAVRAHAPPRAALRAVPRGLRAPVTTSRLLYYIDNNSFYTHPPASGRASRADRHFVYINFNFIRFGGNGCKGTWPSHAYDYVQNRGLPALDDYPAYKEKVFG